MKTNLILGAHPDDEILGVGGTAASLSQKGETVKSIVFSRGNKFPPWWNEEKLSKTRKEESRKAAKILGIKKTYFLGLKDMGLPKSMNEKIIKKVRRVIKKEKPDRLFYHSKNDTHPDHMAVNNIVKKALAKISQKPKCYTYETSSFISFFERKEPKIFFDITNTLDEKISALKAFESQKLIMLPLIPLTTWRAINFGRKAGFKYAERFNIATFLKPTFKKKGF
ncbi:MAG: PIG-L family deacetylase [Nanoarchaeota archaeon]|nr:PIG-L family deacetylase [Nanoarchaeota archaeon]